uniref:ORF1a protein n=1 Tax=Rousettus bat astrovirus TaxID=3141900 RepID=A0AAU7E2Q3_9VIRU
MASASATASSGGLRPAGGFSSVYDKFLWNGSLAARHKALALDNITKTKLKDLFGDNARRYLTYVWKRPVVTAGVVGVQTTPVKTISVSGVGVEGDYVAYAFDPSTNDWVEIDPEIHQETALIGVTVYERRRLAEENKGLKSELSQAKLDLALLRHEYERVRPAPIVRCRFSISTIVLLGLLIGLCFASLTKAESALPVAEGVCTKFSPTGSCLVFIPYNNTHVPRISLDSILNYTREVIASVRFKVVSSPLTPYVKVLMYYLMSWEVCATCLGVATAVKSEHPLWMLATLVLAHVSGFRFSSLAAVPWLNQPSALLLLLTMGVFYFDQPGALLVAPLGLVALLVASLAYTNDIFFANLRGGLLVVFATLVSHLSNMLGFADQATVFFLLVWRAYCLSALVIGDRIEIKDPTGKVKKVISAGTGFLLQKANFGKFFQKRALREGISPTARLTPNSIVRVSTADGEGTGFRVQNYIVTAGHVVTSDEAKITWGKNSGVARVVHRCEKDIVILSLPPSMQGLPTYKFPKQVEDGPIVVVGDDDTGTLLVSISEGIVVGDNITYAVQTKNGQSGCPVTNTDGRVVAVHCANTGFSGGGVIIRADDLPSPKSPKELALEAKIKEMEEKLKMVSDPEARMAKLEAALEQSRTLSESQVVDIVRAAVATEMLVLRAELNKFFDQAKGKTKHGRGRAHRRARGGAKRRKAFTEEEYKAMLEKGMTRDEIRALAEEILNNDSDPDFGSEYDSYDDEAGYPKWSDHGSEDDDEINREWFGQCSSEYVPEDPVATHPEHLMSKFSLEYYMFTEAERKRLGQQLAEYQKKLKAAVERATWVDGSDGVVTWAPGVSSQEVLKDLYTAWNHINQLMQENGFLTFDQRKKKPVKEQPKEQRPKNRKRGGKLPPPPQPVKDLATGEKSSNPQ